MENNYECKRKAKKPLISVIIIATAVVIILLVSILVFAMNLKKEQIDEISVNSAVVTHQLVNDTGSSPYYAENSWCPNYGYVTGAKNKYREEGTFVYYKYDLNVEEFESYIAEIKANNFELNQVSDTEQMCFNREYNGKTQFIGVLISYDDGEITIFATEE